jgi:hypothetical protein
MVHNERYAQEIFWLRRRIEFLECFDNILRNSGNPDHDGLDLSIEFAKVKNPDDLFDRIKDIYKDHYQTH